MATDQKSKVEKDSVKVESNKAPVKEVKREVKEVLVETKKDTSTPPTTFEEREKIEKEVTMIKVGRDQSGRWLWARSDRITEAQKKQRQEMIDNLKKGLRV